ncbi:MULTISPECIES: hypothetical protein [unclassified Streptomyces]|uniref:hypothetical protein n=1 Tax=unclassified Streptomyces TaxID=2593676 RepID=UPI0035E30CD4
MKKSAGESPGGEGTPGWAVQQQGGLTAADGESHEGRKQEQHQALAEIARKRLHDVTPPEQAEVLGCSTFV